MGTFNSTAFDDYAKDGQRNVLFNGGKEDGDRHGHVASHRDASGEEVYDHVRDVEGTEYDVGR